MEVVEDAADLPELALLEEHGGVRLGQLTAKSVELLDVVAIAAYQVAEDPGSCGLLQGSSWGCSRSTRWMVARETR